MPCLVLTGHPCCGKSTLARLLKERALRRDDVDRVVIVTDAVHEDDDENDDGNDDVATTTAAETDDTDDDEKAARARLKSRFDRRVAAAGDRTLLIADAANAVKGFRYELHCLSRAARQAHGVVWAQNSVSGCRARSAAAGHRYGEARLRDLVQRYEPPDERNRWDRPLFRVDLRSEEERRRSAAGGTSVEQELLRESIYDMHNLKLAAAATAAPGRAGDSIDSSPAAATALKPQRPRGSSFKRAPAAAKATSKPPGRTDDLDRTVDLGTIDEAVFRSLAQPTPTAAPTVSADGDASTAVAPSMTQETASSGSMQTDLSLSLEQRIDRLLDAFLTQTKRLEQGTSTVQHIASDANVLHTIDVTTQQVLQVILAQQEAPPRILNGEATPADGPIHAPPQPDSLVPQARLESLLGSWRTSHSNWSAARLNRLRQQFLKWTAMYPPTDTTPAAVAEAFLDYMEHRMDH